MHDENPFGSAPPAGPPAPPEEEYVIPTVVEESRPPAGGVPQRARPPRVWLPLLLFLATCLSTFWVGTAMFPLGGLRSALQYSGALMLILALHEAGHFLQARRYRVAASLPYFIPVPMVPIGTLGAVIGMSSRIRDRRALFDIGITGPLAGLVPTLIFCVLGVLQLGPPVPLPSNLGPLGHFGDPLLLKLLYRWRFGPIPEGWDVFINPWLWAGWVGLLVTSLNLMPIGQLDGGHVLYAMIRQRAHRVAVLFLVAGAVAVIFFGCVWMTLMLVLLVLIGPKHPPTAQDDAPLGFWRHVIGWLTLAFIAVGFTLDPFPNVYR